MTYAIIGQKPLVDVVRALKNLGLSLRKAHLVLDWLAEGKEVPTELDTSL